MQIENLDIDIVRQLENNGLKKSDKEQQIKLLLTLTYMAVRMYWTMSPEDRILASEWHKKFRRSFPLRKFLKERKTRSRKSYLPPAPPMLKKEYKEKTDKTTPTAARVKRTLKVRKEEFWNELLTFEGKYDRQTLLKFYYYWAEELENLNMMKWEAEKARRSFDIKCRLGIWSKRSYETDDKAADIHFERVKGKKPAKAAVNTSEQKAIAAEREAADAQREEATAKAKADSITMEEYLKNNPDSILRTLKKND